mmetsp:Transcript_27925/g.45338  ORF Transcript_27925/g.45338 Transcript_27925/m.45338 type:complete len:146 (+) Transcript_27925:3-440(+)
MSDVYDFDLLSDDQLDALEKSFRLGYRTVRLVGKCLGLDTNVVRAWYRKQRKSARLFRAVEIQRRYMNELRRANASLQREIQSLMQTPSSPTFFGSPALSLPRSSDDSSDNDIALLKHAANEIDCVAVVDGWRYSAGDSRSASSS